jgi:hypothetical protein
MAPHRFGILLPLTARPCAQVSFAVLTIPPAPSNPNVPPMRLIRTGKPYRMGRTLPSARDVASGAS